MTRRQLGSGAPRFEVAGAVDDLRQLVARAEALVHAVERAFEEFGWSVKDDDGDEEDGGKRRLERLAHLLGAAKEAVQAAEYASGQIAAELAKHGRST